VSKLVDDIQEAGVVAAMPEGAWRELVWAKLSKIDTQATLTNGRVTKLETWRLMAIGALSVITAVVVPLFLKVVMEA